MELVSLGMEALQNIAEHVASYRFGQSVLRQLDRTLWVVEKCARWAVPPPLDQDERPQPELVRPLPWVFFLMMLIALRVTRESISLVNLIMGKPPLRSADVVMFIQSKRRYLRTLKYQGNRMMRARTSAHTQEPWYSGLLSLFELTMCFRRQSLNYGNNNTTRVTNNDEVVVIQRTKRGRQEETPDTANVPKNETTMERLIEKMMLDLDAESDEDSSYTLTNATSPKSDRSELTESDQDTLCKASTPTQQEEISQTNGDDIQFSPNENEHYSSTPERTECDKNEETRPDQTFKVEKPESEPTENGEEDRRLDEDTKNAENTDSLAEEPKTSEDSALPPPPPKEITPSPKEQTESFISKEAGTQNSRSPKKEHKIANGRTVKSVPSKKKGNNHRERRVSNEALQQRVLPSHSSF